MRSDGSPGERIERLWLRFSRYPGGTWLFSRLLGRLIPYSGTIGAQVAELEAGCARVQLHDRRRVRNHLRSIHAIALLNLGELTTGLALNCGLPGSMRAILVKISMEYHSKARGTVIAECRCDPPRRGEEGNRTLIGELRDGDRQLVATVDAVWRVGPIPGASR